MNKNKLIEKILECLNDSFFGKELPTLKEGYSTKKIKIIEVKE